MEPIVNLEETPGKVVGKIKRRPPAEAQDWMVAQFHAMGLKLPYPKGVYRFKTHEEANEWEWKHMIEAAKKKFCARRDSKIELPLPERPPTRCWRRIKAWWKASSPD